MCGKGIYVRPHLNSFPEYPSFDYRRSPITVVAEFRHRSTHFSASGGSLFHLAPPLFGLACDPPFLKKIDQKYRLHAAPGFLAPANTDLNIRSISKAQVETKFSKNMIVGSC